MGRHKGVGMPRAKKQKLDAVRDRALEQVATADAESAGPLVALEPAAALPAARAPRAADKLNEIQQRVARLEAWKAAYQHLDLQRTSDVQSERLSEKNAEGHGAMGPSPFISPAESRAAQLIAIHAQFVDVMNEQQLAHFKKAVHLAEKLAFERLEALKQAIAKVEQEEAAQDASAPASSEY